MFFFFIPWTKKLYLLLLIFNKMFPNALHVVPRHYMDVQVKNYSNVSYRFYATVIFGVFVFWLPCSLPTKSYLFQYMCYFQRMKHFSYFLLFSR